MSTNGVLKDKILRILLYYNWIQVTINNDSNIDFYRDYPNKINLKIAGDEQFTMEKLKHFMDYTKDFERRSVTIILLKISKNCAKIKKFGIC